MARYFFDAVSEDLAVTDFHGREIWHRDEVRPAMLEAVRAIRDVLGHERATGAWSLEVRLGDHNRVAALRFDEIEAVSTDIDAGAEGSLAA